MIANVYDLKEELFPEMSRGKPGFVKQKREAIERSDMSGDIRYDEA